MKRAAAGSILLFLLGQSGVWAAQPWKDKRPADWTEKDITRILLDSPWAHSQWMPVLVAGETPSSRAGAGESPAGPRPGTPGRPRYGLYKLPNPEPLQGADPGPSAVRVWQGVIQWASSRTLREAHVRLEQLYGTVSEEAVRQRLQAQDRGYTILVRGPWVRDILQQFDEAAAAAISQAACLRPRQYGREIHPSNVTVTLEGDDLPTVEFTFPRRLDGKPVIGPREKKVEFLWQLSGQVIRTDFDLRKMQRDAKPDL